MPEINRNTKRAAPRKGVRQCVYFIEICLATVSFRAQCAQSVINHANEIRNAFSGDLGIQQILI